MMDDVSNYNRKRWNALARANALFTRPALYLDVATARQKIDPEGRLGELAGKQVLYHLHFANPFFSGLIAQDWDGNKYPLKYPYVDRAEMTYRDQDWMYNQNAIAGEPIPGPREYRHTLSTVINGLIEHGFVIYSGPMCQVQKSVAVKIPLSVFK
jgi:hypothetical protein